MPRKPRVQFPVAAEHEVEASSYIGFRSRSPGRDVAALKQEKGSGLNGINKSQRVAATELSNAVAPSSLINK